MNRLTIPFLTVLALPTVAPAQDPAAAFDTASWAWEAGRYVESLERFERLLSSPGGDKFLEPIALLTGELYRTTYLAPDGRRVLWSRDGRYAAFEEGFTGAPAGGGRGGRGGGAAGAAQRNARAVLFRREGDSLAMLGEIPGFSITFLSSPDRVAYLSRDSVPRVMVRDLGTASEQNWPVAGLTPVLLVDAGDDAHVTLAARSSSAPVAVAGGGGRGGGQPVNLYEVDAGTVTPLTEGDGNRIPLFTTPGGSFLVYSAGQGRFAVRERATGITREFAGSDPAIARDGSALVFTGREVAAYTINILTLAGGQPPREVKRTDFRLASPALSPDGRRVVFQMMPREDWELYVIGVDGTGEKRLTHEIQHDLLPRFLTNDRVLATIGEARHRRSYLHDVATGTRTRLFHNNSVRTVAPEYAWADSPDGSMVLIVADRDGNTVSPERAVYLTRLNAKIGKEDLIARLRDNLAAERDLRTRGTAAFAPIAVAVRAAVADVSSTRIHGYARDLFDFDSKHVSQPGNRLAIDYLTTRLRAFGYEPEQQWFEPQVGRGAGAATYRTANMVVTIRGTTNPDLVYVAGSHFDSVEGGPGADDDASGSTALLEAARVLIHRPQAATIKLVFFTGEEAGLLGSREFVRRAVADSMKLVGALNNDMIGWMNDNRLDNTIRYSNDGIRDIQHAAAFLFTDLITYDSRYYQSTDAAAFWDRYGDIVGGIGSYPILGNPHYHQSHDVLETIDQRLVAEVSKTTVATLMLLASSPARLTGLKTEWNGPRATVTWTSALERGVARYRVTYGPPDTPARRSLTVRTPRAELADAQPGWAVAVKAVLGNGLESWDWARTTIPAKE